MRLVGAPERTHSTVGPSARHPTSSSRTHARSVVGVVVTIDRSCSGTNPSRSPVDIPSTASAIASGMPASPNILPGECSPREFPFESIESWLTSDFGRLDSTPDGSHVR